MYEKDGKEGEGQKRTKRRQRLENDRKGHKMEENDKRKENVRECQKRMKRKENVRKV